MIGYIPSQLGISFEVPCWLAPFIFSRICVSKQTQELHSANVMGKPLESYQCFSLLLIFSRGWLSRSRHICNCFKSGINKDHNIILIVGFPQLIFTVTGPHTGTSFTSVYNVRIFNPYFFVVHNKMYSPSLLNQKHSSIIGLAKFNFKFNE